MKTTKKLFTLLLLSAFIYSCDNSDTWSPPAPLGSDNPGAYFVIPDRLAVAPEDTYFTLTLSRVYNTNTALQIPITIVEDNPDLIIPTSVTFAAGSTIAELRIEVLTPPCDDYPLFFTLEFDDRYFDPWRVGITNRFYGFVPLQRPPTRAPVTVDNIPWFVMEDDVDTFSIFHLPRPAPSAAARTFNLVLMSPRIYAWQEEHRIAEPTFSHFGIRIRRSAAQDSFTSFYTRPGLPYGQFFWGQPDDNSGMFRQIRTVDANPNTDVTFVATRLSGSNAPYGTAVGATLNVEFREWLNTTRFRIIQDWCDPENVFWFRNKDNRHEWFKVVSQ